MRGYDLLTDQKNTNGDQKSIKETLHEHWYTNFITDTWEQLNIAKNDMGQLHPQFLQCLSFKNVNPKVFIHPDYVKNKRDQADIALVIKLVSCIEW